MEIRTDRVGLLVEQLTESAVFSRDRLDAMSDEEFWWEPAPSMWSIRKRDEATTPKQVVEFSTSAQDMMARLWAEIDRWVAAVEKLTDEQLDMIGFGQYPQGLDPQLPFIGIVRWVNREAIHHLAEAALLRDLYRTRAR